MIDLTRERQKIETDIVAELGMMGAYCKLMASVNDRKTGLAELQEHLRELEAEQAELQEQIADIEDRRTMARAEREIAERGKHDALKTGGEFDNAALAAAGEKVRGLDNELANVKARYTTVRNGVINTRLDAKQATGDLAQIEAMIRPVTPALDLLGLVLTKK